jgi:hypothetical protein
LARNTPFSVRITKPAAGVDTVTLAISMVVALNVVLVITVCSSKPATALTAACKAVIYPSAAVTAVPNAAKLPVTSLALAAVPAAKVGKGRVTAAAKPSGPAEPTETATSHGAKTR